MPSGVLSETLILAKVEDSGENIEALFAACLDELVAFSLNEQNGCGEGLAAETEQTNYSVLQTAGAVSVGNLHPLTIWPSPFHLVLSLDLGSAQPRPGAELDPSGNPVVTASVTELEAGQHRVGPLLDQFLIARSATSVLTEEAIGYSVENGGLACSVVARDAPQLVRAEVVDVGRAVRLGAVAEKVLEDDRKGRHVSTSCAINSSTAAITGLLRGSSSASSVATQARTFSRQSVRSRARDPAEPTPVLIGGMSGGHRSLAWPMSVLAAA